MYMKLLDRIERAKKATIPRDALYESYGAIKMARELDAITTEEFLLLNHACVAEGINNPIYF